MELQEEFQEVAGEPPRRRELRFKAFEEKKVCAHAREMHLRAREGACSIILLR